MTWYPPPPTKPDPIPCTHLLHLILTLVSFGLWLPIWFLVAMSNEAANRKIDKDYRERLAEYNRFMWQHYGPGTNHNGWHHPPAPSRINP